VVGAVTLVDDEELQLASTHSIAAATADPAGAANRVTWVLRRSLSADWSREQMSFDSNA
jgi:hypothetical protein